MAFDDVVVTGTGGGGDPGEPQDDGPGGPILVVATPANPFTRYLGEILRAEGLNAYPVTDIATVTAATLAGLRRRHPGRDGAHPGAGHACSATG